METEVKKHWFDHEGSFRVAIGFLIRTYSMIWLILAAVRCFSFRSISIQIYGVASLIAAALLLHNLFDKKVSHDDYFVWGTVSLWGVGILLLIFVYSTTSAPSESLPAFVRLLDLLRFKW